MIVNVLLALTAAVAATTQTLRWVRVLQREHYDARSLVRFVMRWQSPALGRWGWTALVGHAVTLSLVLAGQGRFALVSASVVALLTPVGLSPRARTGAIVYTRRCVTTMILGLVLAVAVVGATRRGDVSAVVLALAPWWFVVAAAVNAPIEKRLAQRFVASAASRLRAVAPTVVAVTGSYGKTSTKNHLLDLLTPSRGVVATPKSFNNRAGLSRAINENLADGTTVFIAEMGTYGPGEIADMVSWCPPAVSIITAIGPVHLERMGTLDVIERAKFEITTGAHTVILNVDNERLRRWPTRLAPEVTVITAGSQQAADVRVQREGGEWVITTAGRVVRAPVVVDAQPTNVACALAAGLALGDALDDMVARLSQLRAVEHRAEGARAASGVWVIDDTFNANPASAAASLSLLRQAPATGRRLVVTPGMVELGVEQRQANRELGAAVRRDGAELVVVGLTNARALREGFGTGARSVAHRADAVAFVRQSLHDGDAVLYLNDLPDHYP